MRSRVLLRAAAATALTVTVAVPVGAAPGPAAAAGGFCTSTGVNVVVDFKELGGGLQKGCDPRGADRPASDVVPAAGSPLAYVQRQPGFVCRVAGEPANDPCVNTPPPDAYWGLWWSDGTSGRWTYASQGVGSLKVPSGGSVAFSWIGPNGSTPPGVAPPVRPRQQPKPSPATGAGPRPRSDSTAPTTAQDRSEEAANPRDVGDSGAPASPRAERGEQRDRASSPGARPSSDGPQEGRRRVEDAPGAAPGPATTSPSAQAVTTSQPTAAEDAGAAAADERLPTWVPLVALALLLAGTAGVAVRRRLRATR